MDSRAPLFTRAAKLLLAVGCLTVWSWTILNLTVLPAGAASSLPAAAGFSGSPGGPGPLRVLSGASGALADAQLAADRNNPRNLLETADRSLSTWVGTYGDCSGKSALTHASAAVDTCITGLYYFIGHNPGVFTPLMSVGVGSIIEYYDGAGHHHRLQVIAERTWLRKDGVPPPAEAGEAAQFQTCVTPDGSVDRILDAVEA